MWVVVTDQHTNTDLMVRELADDEIMDERVFADEVAQDYGVELAESDGYIPNCCGDIRVEFRENPENGLVIWSGQSFYFA